MYPPRAKVRQPRCSPGLSFFDVLDRNGNNTYLNAYIEILNQDVSQINISTVKMNGIPALNISYSFVANPEILDRDSNGNPEMKIVFDKKSIQSVLTKGENDVTVTGQINNIFFVGTGVIAVYTTSTPKTSFSANSTAGNAPLTAAFTSTSSGYPDMWMWDFGDGEQSYEKNPVHVSKFILHKMTPFTNALCLFNQFGLGVGPDKFPDNIIIGLSWHPELVNAFPGARAYGDPLGGTFCFSHDRMVRIVNIYFFCRGFKKKREN